jgi:hypothetical protein
MEAGGFWFRKIEVMTHQTSFSQAEFADKKKITRREKFLTRMRFAKTNIRRFAVVANNRHFF